MNIKNKTTVLALSNVEQGTCLKLKAEYRHSYIMAHNGKWNFSARLETLILKAKEDGAFVVVGASDYHEIIDLYLNDSEMPLLIRNKELLLMSGEGISLKKYELPNGEKNSHLLGGENFFEITGSGPCFIELPVTCSAEPYLLKAGERVLVLPKMLMAMTKNIRIVDEPLVDGYITLEANVYDGKYYI